MDFPPRIFLVLFKFVLTEAKFNITVFKIMVIFYIKKPLNFRTLKTSTFLHANQNKLFISPSLLNI